MVSDFYDPLGAKAKAPLPSPQMPQPLTPALLEAKKDLV
jgi:hypothetical protein